MTAPLLQVEGLSIVRDTASDAPSGAPLVDCLGLSLELGTTLGIVGESGSGKSMTAYALAGLLPPGVRVSAGSIRLNGNELSTATPSVRRSLAGRHIGMVFQDPLSSLNPVRTVGDLLVESLCRHSGLQPQPARERAVAALRDVDLPDPQLMVDRYPHALSGGQRQRAMLALAMINDPQLLLADEPTTALDATVQKRVLELLARAAAGRGLILITHDIAVAASVCQQLLVMHRGRVVESGPTAQLLAAPQAGYTAALIGAARGTGRRPRPAPRTPGATPGAPLLSVRNLSVDLPGRRGPVRVLTACTLEIERGEILAVVGESGSGKSTLARAIAGVTPAPVGRVWLDGADLAGLSRSERRRQRRRIQMVFQDPDASLNPLHRIGTILTEPLIVAGRLPRQQHASRVDALLHQVQLDPALLMRRPRELSGGQKQRVAIARALALQPDLLIADEVLASLDVQTQAQIAALLRALVDSLGLGLLFISHDLSMVERLADRVAVLKAGRIVEYGTAAAVLGGGGHAYTRELLSARLDWPPRAGAHA